MAEKSKKALIGGQAVMEGVMMRGGNAMALAVRDPDGDIQLETYRRKGNRWTGKIPVLRGVIAFFESLVSGMKMLTRSSDICAAEDEKIGKGGTAFAIIVGILISVGVFIVIPELIADLVERYFLQSFSGSEKVLLYSLAGGVTRITIFVAYLIFCSRIKDVRRVFMYHGAEHKTINCFEAGTPLTVENIQKCSTVHRRCGTTFLFIVMMVSILLFAAVNWLFAEIEIELNDWYRMAIKLALLPVVAGVSYEFLKFFAILPYNFITKIFMLPGLALQKLTTKQPDDGMVEVALRSFNAVHSMMNNPSMAEVKFFDHPYKYVKDYMIAELAKVGAEEAEAYWILSDITGLSRNKLYSLTSISNDDFKKIKQILMRRALREPLDYILGYSVFYGRKIKVNEDVLIPRMETEILCEQTLKEIGQRQCSVLDLCTGSGCIALTLLSESAATVTASDISQRALSIAAYNLEGKSCELVLSDMFSSINKKFDVIVSNPPYIKSTDITGLQPEVICQPKLAIDGGADGLYYYREIIKFAPEMLNKNGVILFEIGFDQAYDVTEMLSGRFRNIVVIKDLSGKDRVVRAELL